MSQIFLLVRPQNPVELGTLLTIWENALLALISGLVVMSPKARSLPAIAMPGEQNAMKAAPGPAPGLIVSGAVMIWAIFWVRLPMTLASEACAAGDMASPCPSGWGALRAGVLGPSVRRRCPRPASSGGPRIAMGAHSLVAALGIGALLGRTFGRGGGRRRRITGAG